MRIIVEPATLPKANRVLLYESDDGAGYEFKEQD